MQSWDSFHRSDLKTLINKGNSMGEQITSRLH